MRFRRGNAPRLPAISKRLSLTRVWFTASATLALAIEGISIILVCRKNPMRRRFRSCSTKMISSTNRRNGFSPNLSDVAKGKADLLPLFFFLFFLLLPLFSSPFFPSPFQMRPRISIWGSVRPSVCPLPFKRNRRKRRFQPARRILLPTWACFSSSSSFTLLPYYP